MQNENLVRNILASLQHLDRNLEEAVEGVGGDISNSRKSVRPIFYCFILFCHKEQEKQEMSSLLLYPPVLCGLLAIDFFATYFAASCKTCVE